MIVSDTEIEDIWKEDFLQSLIMLKESGVIVRLINSNEDIIDELILNLSNH